MWGCQACVTVVMGMCRHVPDDAAPKVSDAAEIVDKQDLNLVNFIAVFDMRSRIRIFAMASCLLYACWPHSFVLLPHSIALFSRGVPQLSVCLCVVAATFMYCRSSSRSPASTPLPRLYVQWLA